jgi:hypothetical protein
MGEIFISHSSADETVAEKVADALRQQGHNVFLDSDRVDGIAPVEAKDQGRRVVAVPPARLTVEPGEPPRGG